MHSLLVLVFLVLVVGAASASTFSIPTTDEAFAARVLKVAVAGRAIPEVIAELSRVASPAWSTTIAFLKARSGP
jgi:hypothetical protein